MPGKEQPNDQPVEAMAEEALRSAKEAISSIESAGAPTPLPLPDFTGAGGVGAARAIDLLGDVNLHVRIELGRTRMLVEEVLQLGEGAVVELDKLAGDPVDVYVNDRHVARGEVLVLNDNFCVRINEIISSESEAAGEGKVA
jgi:flagellar motor switch protein FliN/FliY